MFLFEGKLVEIGLVEPFFSYVDLGIGMETPSYST